MQLLIDPDWFAPAAGAAEPPDESRQLDFWLGEWALTWDVGSTRNVIRPIFGGRAILETFDEGAEDGLRGVSISSWDALRATWVQLWADNQGNVFDLHGGPVDEASFELRTDPAADGSIRRMLFSQIEDDSLEWEWSRRGGGDTEFTPLWQVHYRRLV
jgi:hypothetical protein